MPEAAASLAAGGLTRRASVCGAGLFGVALLLIFHETTWSMVSTWMRSETFTHGFLILPISLWLLWNERVALRRIDLDPAPWVALLIVPFGVGWLLGWKTDVLVVQQLALVSMLNIGIWSIVGHKMARAVAFPLFFLYFAVPIGEALVAPMMEFTATSTVWLIKQTSIPVYREGMFFTLPSGNWSVVEACSGVRYIIASLTLGVLYAYLTYKSQKRRLLFILASFVVPILANTVRAFVIVMLGHFSSMKLATGVDHLIYGWVFFGVVMFLLFWLGSLFSEDQAVAVGTGEGSTGSPAAQPVTFSRLMASALLALVLAGIWPTFGSNLQTGDKLHYGPMVLPPAQGAWKAHSLAAWLWQPESAVKGHAQKYYALDEHVLGLFIQHPENSGDEGEIVGSSSKFVANKDGMRIRERDAVRVNLGDADFLVDQAVIKGARGEFLVWSWYRIGHRYTSNDYVAKLVEAWSSVGRGTGHTYRVVLASPLGDTVASTQEVLQDFLQQHGASLDGALERAMETTR